MYLNARLQGETNGMGTLGTTYPSVTVILEGSTYAYVYADHLFSCLDVNLNAKSGPQITSNRGVRLRKNP